MKLDDAPGKDDEPIFSQIFGKSRDNPRNWPIPTHAFEAYGGSTICTQCPYGKSLHPVDIGPYRKAAQVSSEQQTTDHDPVNHPRHYTAYKGLEIIDLTEQMNFNLGNAVKYVCRAGLKDPEKTVEDLEKGIWYIRREIERLKGHA